jgi:shikimate dehydrogenase
MGKFVSPDSVLTLSDLTDWQAPGPCLAVLGHPIKHSISPVMHNAALAKLARSEPEFGRWTYYRFDVPPERLPEALDHLHRAGFAGMNLTVPHKILAFNLTSNVDPAARPIGAVNTLRRSPQGWDGFNTDGYGLSEGIRETLGRTIAGADILLLGAGGAARGAAVECLQLGCRSLTVVNRTQANRDALIQAMQGVAGNIPLRGADPLTASSEIPAGTIVINATSAGLNPKDPAPIDLERIPRPAGVYDMIYNPAVTPLLAQANRMNIPTANGLSMLVHQGARAFEIWTGRKAPVDVMKRAVAGVVPR